MKCSQLGVTLLELLVTLSIFSIVLAFAVPSLRSMTENNKVLALSNQVVSAINFTRSEAVKRNYNVVMCVKGTGQTCSTTNAFEQGWIVFVDCNADSIVTTSNTCDFDGNGTPEAPEPVLQETIPDIASNLSISNSSTTPRIIIYAPDGRTNINATLRVRKDTLDQYIITLARSTGRVSSCKAGSAGC